LDLTGSRFDVDEVKLSGGTALGRLVLSNSAVTYDGDWTVPSLTVSNSTMTVQGTLRVTGPDPMAFTGSTLTLNRLVLDQAAQWTMGSSTVTVTQPLTIPPSLTLVMQTSSFLTIDGLLKAQRVELRTGSNLRHHATTATQVFRLSLDVNDLVIDGTSS